MIVLFLFLIEGSNNMKIEEINIKDERYTNKLRNIYD